MLETVNRVGLTIKPDNDNPCCAAHSRPMPPSTRPIPAA